MEKGTTHILAIILVVLLVLMMIPFRVTYLDGGSRGWNAALWQVKECHEMLDAEGHYLVGTRVTLLFGLIPVYDNTVTVLGEP